MRPLIFILTLMLSTACASQIMQGYVGKDIKEVMLTYGPPINEIDMGKGKRAFQWSITQSYSTPAIINQNSAGSASVYGNQIYASGRTTSYITPSNTNTRNCFYTLFAEKQKSGWIVTGFKQPEFMCE